jgi:cytochrome P450
MTSADAVRDFQLTRVPPEFLDDPYPWYAALRAHDPVHALEGGSVFLARYDAAGAGEDDVSRSR